MRQFLAIELSNAWREDLRALQRQLRQSTTGWRWVAPESIHLTLRFLGEVPSQIDERCRESWRRVAGAARPFEVRLSGVGSFPLRGRPRLLWVGVHEEGPRERLKSLAVAFEKAAREAGFEPENRPFRPHLTLARCRRSGRASLPDSFEFGSRSRLDVDRAVLYRSELLPHGARYTVLEHLALGGP